MTKHVARGRVRRKTKRELEREGRIDLQALVAIEGHGRGKHKPEWLKLREGRVNGQ